MEIIDKNNLPFLGMMIEKSQLTSIYENQPTLELLIYYQCHIGQWYKNFTNFTKYYDKLGIPHVIIKGVVYK